MWLAIVFIALGQLQQSAGRFDLVYGYIGGGQAPPGARTGKWWHTTAERAGAELHFDYTTIGHVTVDEMGDGSRRPGGSAFYSALQAARLGARTLIVTQGVPEEIHELLEPYSGELELRVLPAERTTVLQTRGFGQERSQRMLSWAGAMPGDLEVDSAILHLAPIARESPSTWAGDAGFVGLTPQGLARTWPEPGGEILLGAPDEQALGVAGSCDVLVLNDRESEPCAVLLARASDAGALVVVTAEAGPNELRLPDGRTISVPVAAIGEPVEDLGAGDVYAAALFLSLARGMAPVQAAQFANAAAAIRMLGSGAGAIARRDAVEDRVRELSAPGG